MNFEDMPTVVRRTFDLYLTLFAEENPAATFRVDGDPRREDGGNVIPFVDVVTGARYEVTISDAGEASETVRVA